MISCAWPPPGWWRSASTGSDEIRLAVEATLADPLLVPEGHAITATVEGGVVTLDGSVRLRSHVRIVDHTIHDVLGVVDVVNHLAVANGSNTPAAAEA